MPLIDRHGRKIYGPYLRKKDGRKHVVWVKSDGSKTTISWPKWLMEEHLGRMLDVDETVDHINRDFTDDRLENLRVVPRSIHVSDDARRVRIVKFICAWCKNEGQQTPAYLDHNAKNGKAGPFCGKSCAGKYGAYVQNGGERFGRTPAPPREYYYNTKPE